MPLALVAYTPRGYTAVRMLWIAYTEALEDTMTDTILDSSPLVPDEAERKKIINRLRRLEGQVRGLQSMIDSGQECDAVLTQIMAAKSALNQVSLHIIDAWLRMTRQCLATRLSTRRSACSSSTRPASSSVCLNAEPTRERRRLVPEPLSCPDGLSRRL
jgi:DNA-binding FrmR family transcriptional regulator